MLSLYKKSLLTTLFLITICAISACSLTPIHATNNTQTPNINAQLAAIRVASINADRTGQRLQAAIEDLLNPTGQNTEGLYSLNIAIKTQKNPLAIEQDAEITRYNLTFIAKITLVENATGKTILKKQSNLTGSFQTVASDFATFTVEEDTLVRLIKESAENIRIQLSSYFIKKG